MNPLNLDALLLEARTLSGLADFGPDDFLPALERLIVDLNQSAQISDARAEALRQRLIRLLLNRQWFARDLRDHPEIAEENIASPIEIVSLPRTGSTKLHRLLAASGDFQVMPMWKTHMFARIPGLEAGGEARRKQETREYEAWMLQASPDIRSSHPMFTDEAEEDQWLSECTFRRQVTAVMFAAPNFTQWLAQQDPSPPYAYLHQQMQYLQWQTRQLHGAAEASKPWLLKSPDHFGCERFLQQVFDGVRFIVTHRNPVECLASTAVMVKQFRRLYSDRYDQSIPAAPLLQMVSYWASAHLSWRNDNDNADAPVLDLDFRHITRDGIGTARKVYDYLGMPLTPSAEAAMLNWEANSEREKHGRNVYSLADIGTSPEIVREAFGGYIARYEDYIQA